MDSKPFSEAPLSAAQNFADYALSLIELEYDCPSISTVQSLAILSCYESTRVRDTRGWLYAGELTLVASLLTRHCWKYLTDVKEWHRD